MASRKTPRPAIGRPQRLGDYRRKRDFTSTPEPRGGEAPLRASRPARGLAYCVQKHRATSLLYDFRLEHEGVLLSWAVPKGPSLNPADKRLAVRTEDHPLAYGSFEGVIPEGYGAGVVMLWDRGTWEPESGSVEVEEALAKGEIKFTLHGEKLRGSWVLVRTRSFGKSTTAGREHWLLIKHRDAFARPTPLPAEERSVASGGTFDDILAGDAPGAERLRLHAPKRLEPSPT